jgi:RNA polymerase sigma-70 factor (ECF subfamily)
VYLPPVVLASTFRAELVSRGGGAIPEDDRTLETQLELLVARGRREYPALSLDGALFARHLARCAVRLSPVSGATLGALHVEDLYLACACLNALPGAAKAFDARCTPRLRAALAATAKSAEQRAEIAQRTRTLLLVGESDGEPKIASYGGQGPLDHFVAVVAQRLLFRSFRSDAAELRAREGVAIGAASAGALPAELSYARGRYRADMETALRDALAVLDDRERLLLRLHLVSGISMTEIGKMYGVNQSTASRWLAQARDAVATELQRLMRERLGVSGDEMQSLARLVASQLDASVSRLLAR